MKYKRKKNFTRIEVKRSGQSLVLWVHAHNANSQLHITRYNGGELIGFIWGSLPGVGRNDCASSSLSQIEIAITLRDVFGAWGGR